MMRQLRAALLDVLHQDFVRTAKAKGLSPVVVLYKHALRNALIPVITLVGLEPPYPPWRRVIVEQVFNWPGLGKLILEAIFQRDYPVVMGMVLISGLAVQMVLSLTRSWLLVGGSKDPPQLRQVRQEWTRSAALPVDAWLWRA